MPIKIRVMPDCIVITTQNSRELYGCAEGLSVTGVNWPRMNQWFREFPESEIALMSCVRRVTSRH
jgi:toxic protein SymE